MLLSSSVVGVVGRTIEGDFSRSRLLVVLQSAKQKEENSIIFAEMDKLFETTYKVFNGALDEKSKSKDDISLRFFDQPVTPGLEEGTFDDRVGRTNDDFHYDHLMIMASTASSFRNQGFTNDDVLQFFDSGRNLFIAGSTKAKGFARDMFKEFGAQLYPAKAEITGQAGQVKIQDLEDQGLTATKQINQAIKNTIVNVDSEVAFLGSGIKVDPDNSYSFPILSGNDGLKAKLPSKNVGGKEVKREFLGEDVVLVSGYQSRYNQRAVLSASIEICTDKFINATQVGEDVTTSPNYQFCLETLKWNFQAKSVLKLENFDHSLVDTSLVETGRQKIQEYKLRDEIQVSFDIYEKVDNEWVPFKADDVVLEFIMLNPFNIETMQNTEGAHYNVKFNVPDHNGVYKFKIDYLSPGYTRVYYDEITPVRVFNHDEFPTYDARAYPYFAAVYLLTIAFIIFSASYAFMSDKPLKKMKKD
ncbi:unnamed protein product [Moneuplotes crassus]|uniref:Dolichyl-diphosphooligosaccharide--protein glycosyltransferase 48 kDa subunit n=2 Tax=Euplotes crassus TaxID=5936 RepID=A0AAD1UB06_EUPCR|nr:unnamed protein product [Moneuplotes crassus]